MKSFTSITLAIAALFAFTALAHGGEEHLKGVIQKVEGSVITLTPEKGEAMVVKTDDKTKFQRGHAAAALKDVAVGQRVVIHATKHDGALLATVVKLPPALTGGADAGAAPKAEPDHAHEHKH